MSRLDADIDAWLEGTLDGAAAEQLALRVREDPAVARQLLIAARFDGDLARAVHARAERRALGFRSDRLAVGGGGANGTRALWAVAVAAVLVLAVGMIVVRQGLAPSVDPVLATVVAVDGQASLRRGTRSEPVAVGASLTARSQIVVGTGGSVQVAAPDGSTFTLLPGANFAPVAGSDATRFYLATGRLEAAVAPRRAGPPLTIGTPHAEATVVGTRFILDVASERTDLQVFVGSVRFDDRVTRERSVVATGERRSAGPAVTPPTPPRQPHQADPRLGIELADVGETGLELPFVDVFRTTGPWRGNDERPLLLDSQGWILRLEEGQTAETVSCRGLNGRYPKGRYICRYDGTGRIDVGGDARLIAREPGRMELDVDPANDGIVLRLVATDPDDPVRAIRVFMPGCEATAANKPLHPDFIARWRGAAVVHAGAWAERRGGDADYDWNNRLVPGHGPLPADRGRPLEDTLDVAIALGADVWLRLPHQATDAYVTATAELVHARLKHDQRVYIELGRDLWDAAWEPGRYAIARGKAANLGDYPGVRWYAERSLAVFAAWRAVSGPDPRVVRVLSAVDNPVIIERLLSWRDAGTQVDVLAVIAPVGAVVGAGEDPDRVFELDAVSVTELLRKPLHGLDVRLATLRQRVQGLRLVGVRAGPHLSVSEKTTAPPTWRHRVHVAQFLNDPDIRTILAEWVHVWNRSTGDLILTALPMGHLRDVEGPAGASIDAMGLQAYQAIAPWLQRQADRR